MRKGPDGARQLVPIDHGNTLPDAFTDISFEWIYWPQARAPLGEDINLRFLFAADIPPCSAMPWYHHSALSL